jgi:hypothetical protein
LFLFLFLLGNHHTREEKLALNRGRSERADKNRLAINGSGAGASPVFPHGQQQTGVHGHGDAAQAREEAVEDLVQGVRR